MQPCNKNTRAQFLEGVMVVLFLSIWLSQTDIVFNKRPNVTIMQAIFRGIPAGRYGEGLPNFGSCSNASFFQAWLL